MPRRLPIVRAGGWYHVVNRGENGSPLFPTQQDAEAFVTALGEIAERFPVAIYAYCAMGTHYHLLVRGQEEALLRALANLEAGISGKLERARLRRMAVGRHLLQVTRYIHRNPADAGLVQDPESWPWSSYRGYLDHLNAPHWLRAEAILGWLGSIGSRQRYRQYVEGEGVAGPRPRNGSS